MGSRFDAQIRKRVLSMFSVWLVEEACAVRRPPPAGQIVNLPGGGGPSTEGGSVRDRTSSTWSDPDGRLVEALRAGDEAAFEALVRTYQSSMLRLAETFVRTPATAEDVVQETWLAVMRGLRLFEGRSSLRTWIFQILINRAKSRGLQEQPLALVISLDEIRAEALPERFKEPASALRGPPDALLADETNRTIKEAIAMLPPRQAHLVTLRDVDGLSASEACQLLSISAANQRVLLHRARTHLREILRTPTTRWCTPRRAKQVGQRARLDGISGGNRTPPTISPADGPPRSPKADDGRPGDPRRPVR